MIFDDNLKMETGLKIINTKCMCLVGLQGGRNVGYTILTLAQSKYGHTTISQQHD